MKRPTIEDLAAQAGVSVSTVNRVLAGAGSVKASSMQRVKEAAERIGYFGLGTIKSQIESRKSKLRFGFILLQPSRNFYQLIAASLRAAAAEVDEQNVEIEVIFSEDLSPQLTATKLLELGARCDAIGLVSAVHHLVTEAVETLAAKNVPVFALISQLSATGNMNYVGLDNWKVGRTAAQAVHLMSKAPGQIGILMGNHRYRCQEMNEAGFRSYFREYAPDFQLLEPISTFETNAVAEEVTENLLQQNPDLSGLCVFGGGMSGILTALRNSSSRDKIMCVGLDLTEITKAGLRDGALTVIIAHPLQKFATAIMAGMRKACFAEQSSLKQTIVLPFDLFLRENL